MTQFFCKQAVPSLLSLESRCCYLGATCHISPRFTRGSSISLKLKGSDWKEVYGLEQKQGSIISTHSPFIQLGEGEWISYFYMCTI